MSHFRKVNKDNPLFPPVPGWNQEPIWSPSCASMNAFLHLNLLVFSLNTSFMSLPSLSQIYRSGQTLGKECLTGWNAFLLMRLQGTKYCDWQSEMSLSLCFFTCALLRWLRSEDNYGPFWPNNPRMGFPGNEPQELNSLRRKDTHK